MRRRDRAILIIEVCLTRIRVGRTLRRQPAVRKALEELRSDGAREGDPDDRVVGRLAWASRAVLERLPGDQRCLMQSLTLVSLLDRRGIHANLVIGVRPGTAVEAHAWVTVGGRPVSPVGGHDELTVV